MNKKNKPIVIALGGNALEASANILDYPSLPLACQTMAKFVDQGLVITHGNGPQIGQLGDINGELSMPLDVLGAETEGILGYVVEQELGNQLDDEQQLATLLTRTEVVKDDPAFNDPVKPVGDWIDKKEADKLVSELGWKFKEKDGKYRRLVPSPKPLRTLQLDVIKTLIAAGCTVICAGGGGIPVLRDHHGKLHGLDAVIDKDSTSALLATELDARHLVLATNVSGVYRDWDDKAHDLIQDTTPEELLALDLPDGTMGPKVRAACEFVGATGASAVIGSLNNLHDLITGEAGTIIRPASGGESS